MPAVHNAQRGTSNVVLLTSLGGGAFGNNESWIVAAMRRALEMTSEIDLNVKLVSYGAPSKAFLQMAEDSTRPRATSTRKRAGDCRSAQIREWI
jgi:hypothetical protein